MRELVTVQVGGFANFIGSHFWNFQDELLGLAEDPCADQAFKNQYMDMDVLYRIGETQQGILTYTPRLVSVDFKGALGSMSSRGALYSEDLPTASDMNTWTGTVSTQISKRHQKNLFLQSLDEEQNLPVVNSDKNDSQREYQQRDLVECLENSVEFWTDFSKVHYHPQSLYELSGSGINIEEFDNYGIGKEALSFGPHGEEMLERLRFFVEECEQIQGFQFIVDDSGGFSTVAADFVENIADEYTKTPVMLYSARGPRHYMKLGNRKQTISQGLHDAISFSRLSSHSKLIVPIGLPSLSSSKVSRFLCIKDEKPYHCSAVYAAAIHSVCLPFRMRHSADLHDVSGAVDMNDVIQMLSGQARRNMVAILDVAMPAPSLNGKEAEISLLSHLQTVTPQIDEVIEDLQVAETMSVHGIIGPGGRHASVSEVEDSINAAYEQMMIKPKFCHLSVSRTPLPIPLPFPSIFRNLIGTHGELLSEPIAGSSSRCSLDVHSIPMAARLRSSSAILPYLESRLGNLHNFGIRRGAAGAQVVRSWGFGSDELEDMAESLTRMVMELKPHSESYSSSD